MLPVNTGGYAAYQDTFVSAFLNLFPDPFAAPKQTWDVIVKFWYLDLSETDTIMQEFYSLFKITPLYAILSGFSVDDAPGVGTFYDFFNRLWQSDNDNCSTRSNIKNQNLKKVKNVLAKPHVTLKAPLLNSFPLCSALTFQTKAF